MTYGNIINRIMERSTQPEPVFGMGATICAYTDRYAGTVTCVEPAGKGRIIIIHEDSAVRTDGNGMSDSQTYEYTPSRAGRSWLFRQNKHGAWFEVRLNHDTRRYVLVKGGDGLVLGRRDKRHDFSF